MSGGRKMAKKYYYDGKLYSEKDWDFDRKRPKPKVKAKKAEVIAEPETQVEVELTAEVIETLIQD
jgi:hypothetical protein